MINYDSNYTYLIVPNEYKCVYYNILNVLGTLGEDLLSSCTATCKGRAINGIACYNMFNAACACYHLGQIKRARVLISYIKAQLNISCDNLVIFEDSSNDEFVYLKVPKQYEDVFDGILNKMATWGQELLDDCTTSCKGENKNILNSWNLFQGAMLAYEYGNSSQSDMIVNYISNILNIGFENDGTQKTYYNITVNPTPSNAIVTINGIQKRSITVEENTNVTIVVSAVGYGTYTNTFIATSDANIPVVLTSNENEPINQNVNITIVPTPSDATVTINGNNTKTLTVPKGTQVSYRVYKQDYEESVGSFVASTNTTIPVELVQSSPSSQYATVSVTPNPSDATVTINGRNTNSLRVEIGTLCNIEVSKTGYVKQTKSFTVDSDYLWSPRLSRISFNVTPANVDLLYTAGQVNFDITYDELPEKGVVMLLDGNNPDTLVFYDENNNVISGAIILGQGIKVTNFYTIIPANNTAEAKTYRIIARSNSGNPGYEDKNIVINVAANPNAQTTDLVTIHGAVDEDNNYVGTVQYKNLTTDELLDPQPNNSRDYVNEFDSNPNSHEGVSIIAYKDGYRAFVKNIDYADGDQEITPLLKEVSDDAYLYVTPIKYKNYQNPGELFRNIHCNSVDVGENDFEVDAVPFEDDNNQRHTCIIPLLVQSNGGSYITINEESEQIQIQGYDIPVGHIQLEQYNIIEIEIDADLNKNSSITFVIRDEDENFERKVTVNVLDPDMLNEDGFIEDDYVIVKSAITQGTNVLLNGCSYDDERRDIIQRVHDQAEQNALIVFEHNPSSNNGDIVFVTKSGYKNFIQNINYKDGAIVIQPTLSQLSSGKFLHITPLKYDYNYNTKLFDEGELYLIMNIITESNIKKCYLKLYVQSNEDIVVSRTNSNYDGITINKSTVSPGVYLVDIKIDQEMYEGQSMTFRIDGDTQMQEDVVIRIPLS